MKTYHKRALKYDWGYSCDICGTWQHQSQLIEIQQGNAAKSILNSKAHNEIYYCDGTLQEFIEAAEALDMDYDYEKTVDGYDFQAWYPGDEIQAKIKI